MRVKDWMHLRLNFIKKINKKKSEKKERREQSKLANETSNNKKKRKETLKNLLKWNLNSVSNLEHKLIVSKWTGLGMDRGHGDGR